MEVVSSEIRHRHNTTLHEDLKTKVSYFYYLIRSKDIPSAGVNTVTISVADVQATFDMDRARTHFFSDGKSPILQGLIWDTRPLSGALVFRTLN